MATAPVVVTATPSFPAKNLAELIDYARAHPDAVWTNVVKTGKVKLE